MCVCVCVCVCVYACVCVCVCVYVCVCGGGDFFVCESILEAYPGSLIFVVFIVPCLSPCQCLILFMNYASSMHSCFPILCFLLYTRELRRGKSKLSVYSDAEMTTLLSLSN